MQQASSKGALTTIITCETSLPGLRRQSNIPRKRISQPARTDAKSEVTRLLTLPVKFLSFPSWGLEADGPSLVEGASETSAFIRIRSAWLKMSCVMIASACVASRD